VAKFDLFDFFDYYLPRLWKLDLASRRTRQICVILFFIYYPLLAVISVGAFILLLCCMVIVLGAIAIGYTAGTLHWAWITDAQRSIRRPPGEVERRKQLRVGEMTMVWVQNGTLDEYDSLKTNRVMFPDFAAIGDARAYSEYIEDEQRYVTRTAADLAKRGIFGIYKIVPRKEWIS
jgi:nitrate reductase NapE component